MSSLRVDFGTPPALIFLLALAVALLAFWYYRSTHLPVPASMRLLLTAARAFLLMLIVLLLGEPTLRLVTSSTQPPGLAVLVDESRSMTIVDHQGNRAELLRTLLRSKTLAGIARHADLRYFTFGSRLNRTPDLPADTLSLDQNATDISAAFQALQAEKEGDNLRGVLLLTDGMYNVGRNPVYDATQLGLPVYAVGIGDSSLQRDLVLTGLMTNNLVYSGVSTPVDATIRSAGFGGERVEVTIERQGKSLAHTSLTLEEGNREYSASLSYVPEGEGMQKYTVRVSSLRGELTTTNNERSFFARVLKSKLRLLVIAGQPGPDLTMVRQTLAEDPAFSVTSYAQKRPTGFYEGTLTSEQIDSADCVILIDMPTSETSPQLLDQLKRELLEREKPLLYIAGRDVDEGRLHQIDDALPFVIQSASPSEQLVYFQPSESERVNPILVPDASADFAAWTKLPPVYRTRSIAKARPESSVLGFARINNVTLPDPLMLSRSIGRRKVLALLCYGIWRWRLMAQGNEATAHLLARFLQTGVRWLTVPEERRPLRVAPTQESFSEGEAVGFTGQLYDAAGRPVNDALVHVVAQSSQRVAETDLRSIGNGRYEGTLEGLAAGDYTFRAGARLEGTTMGEDRGRFAVGGMNLEYQDTRMNVDLLRELSYRTGGAYIPPSHVGDLDSLLSSRPSFAARTVTHQRQFELWSWYVTLAAAVLLLAFEWTFRKLFGML